MRKFAAIMFTDIVGYMQIGNLDYANTFITNGHYSTSNPGRCKFFPCPHRMIC